MEDNVLAIVGSTKFHKDISARSQAKRIIDSYLEKLKPTLVVSGGAFGIDQLAEQCAREAGIPVKIFEPKYPRWVPEGYKDRNIAIAKACTELLCIRHAESRTYGSGWTADQAEAMGKPVTRFLL